MFRVTVVSPDASLCDGLAEPLRAAGYEVVLQSDAEEAEPDPAAAPDVLAVDLRHQPFPVRSPLADVWPSAALLAVVSPQQLARLDLTLGLEDFLVAPASPDEFLARVQQILWRHGRAAARHLLTAGDLVLDLANYQVFEAGRPITLTYKEYELLRFLMTHGGTVFTRETLLNRVWGYDFYGGARTVDVHIRRLRAKLDPARYDYLETVRNVGYRFTQPLR